MYIPRTRVKIPGTMVSQHPDHASKPYWLDKPFISTQDETKEAFLSFSELGVSEYKWDWEGKLVDESVMERLLSDHYDFFKKHPLGVDKYLTFRLPNPRLETEFRLGRAFMNLVSAAAYAKTFNLPDTPLFEVILPMTTSAEEMISINDAFIELASLKHPLYRMDKIPLRTIKVIPLFEDIRTVVNSDKILVEYVKLFKKKYKRLPQYIRPYIARSDPSLNSGLIATVLSVKIALSKYSVLEKKLRIPLYPILGSASLPFRGGLTPYTVSDFAKEYTGVRTALLQSAFRYDYPKEDVRLAIKNLEKLLPKGRSKNVPASDEKKLFKIMELFESFYKGTVEQIAPVINKLASHLPKRRERVQHIGLFGYSRGVGKVKLPRAIGFTAALYSIGVPPELIGTGRSLSVIAGSKAPRQSNDLLKKYYLNLKKDLLRAGAYLNKKNLQTLAKKDKSWQEILEDVKGIEEYLGISLGPKSPDELSHQTLTSKILSNLNSGKNLTKLIEKAALLRKSLG